MLMIMKPSEPVQSPPQPAPKPVMDVVPPKPPVPPQPTPEPVKATPKEVVELAVASPGGTAAKPEPKDSKRATKQVVTKPPKPPKVPGSGIGLAIFATVVIVLGLGAMMVYAYLRTNGVSSL